MNLQGGASVLASRSLRTATIFISARGDARPTNFSSEGTSEISQLRSGWKVARRFFRVPQGRRIFSTVLSGRNFLRTVFQPLRGWLISGCRSATQFALAALILFFATGATAETTNTLSDAEIQGRLLAQQLLQQQPTTNFSQTGVFQIRDGKGNRSEIPLRFQTLVTATIWSTVYETTSESNHFSLVVIHDGGKPNQYELFFGAPVKTDLPQFLSGNKTMVPFASSDFWIADLGLEFFHWPAQKILKKEFRRECSCARSWKARIRIPGTNAYSRVVSWIDERRRQASSWPTPTTRRANCSRNFTRTISKK